MRKKRYERRVPVFDEDGSGLIRPMPASDYRKMLALRARARRIRKQLSRVSYELAVGYCRLSDMHLLRSWMYRSGEATTKR